ncbi:MAG TPA: glycosyltransferase [Blastocatellia bacterium]|nr:glycosyltransferase [Blastocatellia bacterium]
MPRSAVSGGGRNVNPKFSVIIPAYNTERFVAETIRSVFAQTYRNHEVIAVDDGSTDGTLQALRRFEPRIRVLTKPRGGPASARNLAIKHATGEYLAFLDSDDLWIENKLAEQAEYLERHPGIGLLFSEVFMFREVDGQRRIQSKEGYTGDPTFSQLLFGNFIPNSTVVIRRACLDRVGLLNESPELIAVEDYEYWMRIARVCPMAGLPKPLVYYRIREGNLMGDGRDIDKRLRLFLRVIYEIERQYPRMWEECRVDRDLLLARLHVRAGFAWKERGLWREALRRFIRALTYSRRPRVLRWIFAAAVLKRWS